MTVDLRAILLIVAVVFFALVGFGVTSGNEHFVLLPLGLAFFAAAHLPFRGGNNL